MNKLAATAKKLDALFKILQTLVDVAGAVILVGLGILLAGAIFRLAPDQIGTGYEMVDVGFVELRLAEGYAPDKELVLKQTAVKLLLGLAMAAAARFGVRYIRNILQPMTRGEPFHGAVSANLRRLALLTLVLGAAVNGIELVSRAMLARGYDLTGLLLGEKITHVTIRYTVDLSFLAVSAAVLLLSYVFRYGEELQRLSDETL